MNNTHSIWRKAQSAEKFIKNGLYGLRSNMGEIILAAEFDEIEVCADFVYVHYGKRHKYFYKNGACSDCIDREDDYRFFDNGCVGLKNKNGDVLLSAIFDQIIDWGSDCDVIYTRKDKDFCYYNHNLEKILYDIENIPEDAYPVCPYNLGEDQNRNVLLCVEPIEEKKGGRDCYAYNQWVRLSRIPRSAIRSLLQGCAIADVSPDSINFFEDSDTYIYSARVCTSSGEMPLSACVEKLKSLDCYDSSWHYLLKISINKKTKINPFDFYNLIKHFENLDECLSVEFAIDNDETLEDGEVRIFQVHYFWDDMGAFLDDCFLQQILPNGSIADIKKILDSKTAQERRKLIVDAYWWIRMSDERDWAETKKVLEFLKKEGAENFEDLISRHLCVNPYYIDETTHREWEFKENVIKWAINNGAQINKIRRGETLIETFVKNLEQAKRMIDKDDKSIREADAFVEWCKSIGAITAAEQRTKVENKLGGVSPVEVLDIVRTT